MQETVISIMNQFGYLGIIFLIAVENIFPPIPSEVILTFSGFMTTYSELTIIGVIIASTIGSLIGAIILYFVGFLLNKDRLTKLIRGRLGHILKLKESDISKADEWFIKKGNRTVLLCRCIPIVRSLISIPAGISKMPLPRFFFYTTIGTVLWNTLLVNIGAALGTSWSSIGPIMGRYKNVLWFFVIILIVYKIIKTMYQRKIRVIKKFDSAS